MKRLISVFISLIILVCSASIGVEGYAADKRYAFDALADIQKSGGFVPGETAAVIGNCYGFISAVCEKLYGVKYQEGLNSDGYTCRHKTGYYYTVKTYKTTSSDTASCVDDIISFFVNNAYPGDIVHYSSLSGSTHTFMIQSIDEEKMLIYHSNYQTRTLSSSTCHIDPIYWSSFRANPTTTLYNSDGSLYSHNSLFYNKQKRGGLGMTINRFTNYEKLFYPNYMPPELSVSRSSSSSIKMSWSAVKGATKYRVQYKLNSASDYTTLSESCTATSYDVKNLTIGNKYNFRVCAYAGNKWQEYSNVITKKALPPTVSSVVFTPKSTGLNVKWAKKTDLSGVKLYRSTTADGTYSLIANLGGKANNYVDTNVKYGVTYYYKVERYVTNPNNANKPFSTTSKAFAGKYVLKTPVISYTRNSADSITFTFLGDNCQDSFDYYLLSDSNKTSTAVVNTDEAKLTLENLNVGEKYTLFVREKTKLAAGSYGSLSVTAAPRPVSNVNGAQRSNGIEISFSPQSDVDGYYIYRCSGGDYSNIAKLTGKTNKTYLDKTVKYNTNYKYIVKAYAFSETGEEVIGDASEASADVKVYLSAPSDVKAVRTSPSRITVSWAQDKNAVKYKLQYKEKGGKWQTAVITKKTSRVIKKLTLGKKYYFRVKSINSIGSGYYCKAVKKKLLPPTPEAPVLKCVKNGIKVSFKTKSYLSGFYIYRASSENGKYKLIKTVEGHKTKSFTDVDTDYGKTYYYKIASYIKKGNTIYKSSKSAASGIKLL